MAMITPMPAFLLDILISANITIAVIVMLVSMYITKPVEFSVFPTTLLLLTLFRLALNISSTRLILMHGNGGTRAAGQADVYRFGPQRGADRRTAARSGPFAFEYTTSQ